MTPADIYALISEGMFVTLIASGPILALALGVGLVIAFFQALTQIQEMTLTFVPKIVVIFLGLAAFLPFMFATLQKFTNTIFDLMMSGAS